jgi:formamidopyrimidine-DNA glycosylase
MPELPEVETVARQLGALAVGGWIERFEVFDPRLGIARPGSVAGRRIESMRRIGKQIAIELSAGERGSGKVWLAVHLRMTGRLLWRDAAGAGRELRRPSPLRARWRLDRGTMLFHDTRRFGTIRLLEGPPALMEGAIDPMDPGFTAQALEAMARGSAQAIKPWLLRQDRLAGMGNIYASEALHAARIHPARRAGSLTRGEARRLRAAIQDVLERAIAAGGTTFSDFQNARGDVGNYQHNLRVYDHAGEPCARCGGAIERIVQQQRATYYCPNCQRPVN